MKKPITKYYNLLLLAVLFVSPGVAAYLFFQHPLWLNSHKVNKGTLLSPPIALTSSNKQSKWRIVFWSPGPCEKSCIKQLDLLARIRLALGRKMYQVDQFLILGEKAPLLDQEISLILKDLDFHVARLSADEFTQLDTLSSEAKIFIVNPENYLILSYQFGVNPNDIYKDLKLLLNTTEQKSG